MQDGLGTAHASGYVLGGSLVFVTLSLNSPANVRATDSGMRHDLVRNLIIVVELGSLHQLGVKTHRGQTVLLAVVVGLAECLGAPLVTRDLL